MKNSATLEDAISIAALAHKGQKEKTNSPYILHPLRIMMRLNTEAEMITGVLHDVVEDSQWTLEHLREKGFSDEILTAVECLTRTEGENYDDYIERIKANEIARQVKLADLEDNMNIQRIKNDLTERDFKRLEKYHKVWRTLSV